jgi:hypothetical protein
MVMHPAVGADGEITLAWLGAALEDAYVRGQMRLLAYLEAVMEDLVFELELGARALWLVALLAQFSPNPAHLGHALEYDTSNDWSCFLGSSE